jgi:hypothetical protein
MSMYIIIQTVFLYEFNKVRVFLWTWHNSSDSSGIIKPNTKFRVPDFSDIVKPVVISGIGSQNPKF